MKLGKCVFRSFFSFLLAFVIFDGLQAGEGNENKPCFIDVRKHRPQAEDVKKSSGKLAFLSEGKIAFGSTVSVNDDNGQVVLAFQDGVSNTINTNNFLWMEGIYPSVRSWVKKKAKSKSSKGEYQLSLLDLYPGPEGALSFCDGFNQDDMSGRSSESAELSTLKANMTICALEDEKKQNIRFGLVEGGVCKLTGAEYKPYKYSDLGPLSFLPAFVLLKAHAWPIQDSIIGWQNSPKANNIGKYEYCWLWALDQAKKDGKKALGFAVDDDGACAVFYEKWNSGDTGGNKNMAYVLLEARKHAESSLSNEGEVFNFSWINDSRPPEVIESQYKDK